MVASIDRSREWANRCMLELQYHDSAYFVTLTYNQDHVPISYYADPETGEAQQSMTLSKRDWQLFMKRLRKAFPDDKIRFYACGEYGSTTFRPHYHAIIFGLHLDDLVPVKDVQRGELGYQYFTSASLQRCWSMVQLNGEISPIGYVMVGRVTWETCAYVARYVMKKQYGQDAQVYEEFNIEPEFTLMSRRPGIARQWFEDHPECYNYDFINLSSDRGGLKIRPPKYFDRLFDVDHHDELTELKAKRQHFAEESKKGMMDKTNLEYLDLLKIKENNFRNRIKNLKRDL